MSKMEDAIRLYYRGEVFEAEKILKLILQEEPNHINALTRFAAIQMDLGKVEEAGTAYLKLAELYEKEDSYEECLGFLEKASSGLPQTKLSSLKGKCFFHLGNYVEALSHLLVSQENNENLFYIGKSYFALNQHNNALRVFREILSRSSDNGEIFRSCYWIGQSLYALGELEEAISCFNSYISFYPDESRVYLDLAICHLNSGCLEEAGSNLLRYRNLGGSREVVSFYQGIVNYHMGKYRESIDLLEQAAINDQVMHWRGLSYYELGLYEDALECFTMATKYDAKSLYYKMMGNCHLKLGSFFEAKICYEKALSIDPSDKNLEGLISISGRLLKSKEG